MYIICVDNNNIYRYSILTVPSVISGLNHTQLDIVDIKPANMEELTEVITAAQFHPTSCHMLIYSSSKGTIRLCDMREKALCDDHSKCECVRGESGEGEGVGYGPWGEGRCVSKSRTSAQE